MSTQPVQTALFILGGITAALYLLTATFAVGDIHLSESGSSTWEPVFWRVVLVGGGLLLIAGIWLVQRSPWVGAALISLGAVAGAVPIFWTIVTPFFALALVVLSVIKARGTSAAILR